MEGLFVSAAIAKALEVIQVQLQILSGKLLDEANDFLSVGILCVPRVWQTFLACWQEVGRWKAGRLTSLSSVFILDRNGQIGYSLGEAVLCNVI